MLNTAFWATGGAADVGQDGVWCSVCNRSFKSQHALDVHIWVSAAHRDPNSLSYPAGAAGGRPMYGPHSRRPGMGRSAAGLAIREGASMRAKVCSVAEDAGVLMQAMIGGRTFFGMVREVTPAPLSDLSAPPGGAAPPPGVEVPTPRRRHQPKVIVIGAGFAGLAAAEELHAMGCKVVVLEARGRIGGRCWTHEADDLPAADGGEKLPLVGRCVDLGAAWIHGVTGNPLAELARQQGVELYQAPSDMVIHGADGAPVAAEEDQEMERIFNELLCQARDAAAAAGGAPDESLGAVLDRLLDAQGGAAHTPTQRQVVGRRDRGVPMAPLFVWSAL